MKHIISLGAGVQSSTMSLMAAKGILTPMPEAAIFADTQDEPSSVYKWLDWLEKELPFPIIRVTKGKLSEASCRVRTSKHGTRYTKHGIPAFNKNPETGRVGIMQRQCTGDFKIDVIQREIRKIIGRGGHCVQWIGISIDEVIRMKPSRKKYIENHYPLIDSRISRHGCLTWMKDNGYPTPPRSACVHCPFHSDAEWLRLKLKEPEAFGRAVEYEKNYQTAMKQTTGISGTPYLHRSGKPLSEVSFGVEPDLFGNECEGHCGV